MKTRENLTEEEKKEEKGKGRKGKHGRYVHRDARCRAKARA